MKTKNVFAIPAQVVWETSRIKRASYRDVINNLSKIVAIDSEEQELLLNETRVYEKSVSYPYSFSFRGESYIINAPGSAILSV